eukprot:COSAG01_NODE_3237_length_6370_cov_4.236007_7_plen_101_part_00
MVACANTATRAGAAQVCGQRSPHLACTFADVIPIHCRVGGFVNPTIWTDKLRATTHIRRGEPTRGIVLARWGGLGKSNGFSYMHFILLGLERWSHGQHGW